MKQSTLAAFFKKPPAGSGGPAPPKASAKPSSSASQRPPKAPAAESSKAAKRASTADDGDSDDEPAGFLPPSKPKAASSSAKKSKAEDEDVVMLDDDEEEAAEQSEGGGEVSSRGRKLGKRKIVIDSSDDEDRPLAAGVSSSATKSSATAASSKSKAKQKKKARYSGDSDDDEFTVSEGTGASSTADADSDDYMEDDADGMDIDTADTSLTSSASKPKAKAKSKAFKSSGGSRPALPKKASSGGAGKILTMAQQEKVAEKAEAEERVVPWRFLKDVKDADKNRKGSPNYDPRTLHISSSDWDTMTPFERQFWEIKQNHFDVVLFFQKGKFSELYEDDAFIGHQEFDLKLTKRVKMSMVGVPSTSLDFWTSKFLAKGYKVGRVDQSETALGAEMRSKGTLGTKKGSASVKQKNGKEIVRRELKNVLTSGTVTDGSMLTDDAAQCLLCIKETVDAKSGLPTFGCVILDATTAEFNICQFTDDVGRTHLETLVRHSRPKELVHEKGCVSPVTLRMLKNLVPTLCVWTALKSESEFLSEDDCVEGLEEIYDKDVPGAIKQFYGSAEAMSALGALVFYLRQLNLLELFTARNVVSFDILDPSRRHQTLQLDGQTLAHIEVLVNSQGTEEGTLLQFLSRTVTPFGKRLFKLWVTAPLQDIASIEARLDAVEDLMETSAFGKLLNDLAKGLPDLERQISRIHAGHCSIKVFKSVLDAFRKTAETFDSFKTISQGFKNPLIAKLLASSPDVVEALDEVEEMFTGEGSELTPHEGHDELFDEAVAEVRQAEADLDEELDAARKLLKCKDLSFRDIGIKDIYQIQVPAKVKVPKDWTKMSGTKDVNRYYSPKSERLVKKLKEAREKENAAVEEFHLRVYERFDRHYHTVWLPTVKILSELDCLVSLARASAALGEEACRPELVASDQAFVDLEELRHPCVVNTATDFIPNDVKLGDGATLDLLTGPNMAGKSTLLRSTCVAVICAQLGCYVPAKRARLSPVDRICTRMGASDAIFANASTFKVELDDARKILMDSTPRTLVILDELGRGTSTHDGLSIAFAVLHRLATHVQCIGFFATHYSLSGDFLHHPNVAHKFMLTSLDEETHTLCFLYKLKAGTASRSFGPHVAKLAGVPMPIVERAIGISADFEKSVQARQQHMRSGETLPLALQADAAWLLRMAQDGFPKRAPSELLLVLSGMRRHVQQTRDVVAPTQTTA